MTYIEKTSYFEVAPLGHTIAYKNVDNLFKKKKQCVYILICYVTYKYDVLEMFKFSLMYLKEFKFYATVYELFDNPSYFLERTISNE